MFDRCTQTSLRLVYWAYLANSVWYRTHAPTRKPEWQMSQIIVNPWHMRADTQIICMELLAPFSSQCNIGSQNKSFTPIITCLCVFTETSCTTSSTRTTQFNMQPPQVPTVQQHSCPYTNKCLRIFELLTTDSLMPISVLSAGNTWWSTNWIQRSCTRWWVVQTPHTHIHTHITHTHSVPYILTRCICSDACVCTTTMLT